ncbi:hypothetical protein ScPMuIL_002527 [Solemya velum]
MAESKVEELSDSKETLEESNNHCTEDNHLEMQTFKNIESHMNNESICSDQSFNCECGNTKIKSNDLKASLVKNREKSLGESDCSMTKDHTHSVPDSEDSFFQVVSESQNDESSRKMVLGMMKKDDSGIDIERSPTSTKDTSVFSDADGCESITESLPDISLGQSTVEKTTHDAAYSELGKDDGCCLDTDQCNAISVENSKIEAAVKESSTIEKEFVSGYMPESIDTEDSDPVGSYDVSEKAAEGSSEEDSIRKKTVRNRKKKDTKESCKRKPGPIVLNSETDSDDEAEDDDEHSDSDDDLDDKDMINTKKSDASDTDSGDEMEVDATKKPKHIWKAVPDLMKREYGSRNKESLGKFRCKVQGSLQMVQRFELQHKMDNHEGCVNALHFNRIGTLLASGSDDLNIILWNWIRNRPALVYDSGHRSNVFQAKFLPFSGDCHVVSCARDGQVRLAELSLTGVCKSTKKLASHKGAAHKLALEYDSPHVFLSCGEDALTYEIDLRQEKPNKLITTKENDKKVPLYSIHSNPSNSCQFCVGGRDHFIRIYDKRKISQSENDGILKKFCPHHLLNSDIKANVTCACYNYNGTEVLGTYNDEDIYLFSNEHSDGANYIHRYSGHRNNQTVKGVNFYGGRSEFIVSGSDCGHVYLWDKETESIVQFMQADDGGVINVLEPHPIAPVLATSGLDHDVKIWAPTSEQPTKLKGLKKLVKKNKKDRDEERSYDPDQMEMMDGQMLWYIMHHIRRARRRAQQEDEASSSSENSDSDSEESEDMQERLRCMQQ